MKKNHYSAHVIIKKGMNEDRTITLGNTVSVEAWTHNINTNMNGHTPLKLATGNLVNKLKLAKNLPRRCKLAK